MGSCAALCKSYARTTFNQVVGREKLREKKQEQAKTNNKHETPPAWQGHPFTPSLMGVGLASQHQQSQGMAETIMALEALEPSAPQPQKEQRIGRVQAMPRFTAQS